VCKNKVYWSIARWVISVVAIGFGLLTIKSGGDVLFWSQQAREEAGNYVPFVLWFNFLSGFFYIAAGISLITRRRWAPRLALLITIAIMLVFAMFSLYIVSGGAYEDRTFNAMSVRTLVWAAITGLAYWLYRGKQTISA